MTAGILEKPRLGPCQVELWPYQNEAIAAVGNAFRQGTRSTLLVMFTGGGKTIVAGMIARKCLEKNWRVLMLAHTDELIGQAADKLDMLGVEVGIEKASQYARSLWQPDAVVASVQTFWRPNRLEGWPQDYFDLIIYDEAHHALAKCNRSIIKHFKKARLLGLTATADRGDGEDIGQIFESVAFERNLAFAWNAPPPGPFASDILPITRDLGIDLRELNKKKNGDYTDADLEKRIQPYIEILANLTKTECGDRSTLVFTPQIKSAQAMATALNDSLGMRAEWTSGDDPHRKKKIADYQDGDTQVLCSCAVLTEGFDAPRTSAIVMLRPTNSRPLYAQIAGRGVRIFPGKENCLLVDPGFITDQHDLVTAADLCDTPGMDSEITEITSKLLKEDKQLSLKEAVERAQEIHREETIVRVQVKEREIKARRVSYSMRDVYNTMGIAWRGPSVAGKPRNPATEKQIETLRKFGVDDCDNMSKTRASTTISFLIERRNRGLASMKQTSWLIARGVDPEVARTMPFEEAKIRLGEIFGR